MKIIGVGNVVRTLANSRLPKLGEPRAKIKFQRREMSEGEARERERESFRAGRKFTLGNSARPIDFRSANDQYGGRRGAVECERRGGGGRGWQKYSLFRGDTTRACFCASAGQRREFWRVDAPLYVASAAAFALFLSISPSLSLSHPLSPSLPLSLSPSLSSPSPPPSIYLS